MLRFLRRFLRLKRTWFWLLLLTGLATWLCFMPLFNLLAYEFCLALALAGSLAGLHLGAVTTAEARDQGDGMLLALRGGTGALIVLLGRVVAANLLLLVLPLAIISLNALRVKNCDYLEGLSFFAIMPALSLCLASCGGALWSLAVPRRWLATLAAVMTLFASLAWGLWRFYDAPPVFGYDPFAGYFPGTLYDQDVVIGAPFLIYRLFNLLALGALVLAAAQLLDPSALKLRVGRLRRLSPRLTAVALALMLGTVTLFVLRGPLGFAINAEQIAAELGGLRRTTHFDIHHAKELAPDEVELLAQDHEFRHAQLTALMGGDPGRIRSFIFKDQLQKRRLMGAGRSFVAKPWRREVYLHQAGFPHPVLKHELAHIFGGLYGDDLFKVSVALPTPGFNAGLIEGLAVAADWRPYGEANGHQHAAALRRIGLAPEVRDLFGHGFMAHAASRAYITAGSFCRYLLERHGMDKLGAVYRSGGDFNAAYGRSLGDLSDDWSRWLRGLTVPATQLQLARERFRRPSVLRRVCSHEVANLTREAQDEAAHRQFGEAARRYETICRFDPGEPSHLLSWATLAEAAGSPRKAQTILEELLVHPSLSKPLRREALETMGDLSWLAGDHAEALKQYQRASVHAAAPGGRRVLHLKLWALKQRDEVRRLVMAYLVKRPGVPREAGLDVHLAHQLHAALTAPRSGLGLYLIGFQLAGRRHCDEATTVLKRAIASPLPNADFEIKARFVLGECQYRRQDLLGAEQTFKALLTRSGLPEGTRLQADDWLQRVQWRRGAAIHPGVPSQ
jgi:Tetratricopeptide repeat